MQPSKWADLRNIIDPWTVGLVVALILALMVAAEIKTKSKFKVALQVLFAIAMVTVSTYAFAHFEDGLAVAVGIMIISFIFFNAPGNLWCKYCGTFRPRGVRVCEKCGEPFPQAWPGL